MSVDSEVPSWNRGIVLCLLRWRPQSTDRQSADAGPAADGPRPDRQLHVDVVKPSTTLRCFSRASTTHTSPTPTRAKNPPALLPSLGNQMAQDRLKSHRTRVDYAVSERQLFPKAAVQPSTWQANANVALGSTSVLRNPSSSKHTRRSARLTQQAAGINDAGAERGVAPARFARRRRSFESAARFGGCELGPPLQQPRQQGAHLRGRERGSVAPAHAGVGFDAGDDSGQGLRRQQLELVLDGGVDGAADRRGERPTPTPRARQRSSPPRRARSRFAAARSWARLSARWSRSAPRARRSATSSA